MASDRFELVPGKPSSVRGFTLEGIVEFECRDNADAQQLLGVLEYVRDRFVPGQASGFGVRRASHRGVAARLGSSPTELVPAVQASTE